MVSIRRGIFVAALLWLASTVSAEDLREWLNTYLKASSLHDLETLRRMTAEDATWQLGPDLLVGRDAVLGPNAYDIGINTRLQWSNIVVKGNVVEFDLIERNDILDALGTALRHYPRFVIENGLVKRKEARKADEGRDERKLTLLRAWIEQNYPEALPKLRTPDGRVIYSEESGRLSAKLATEWAASERSR